MQAIILAGGQGTRLQPFTNIIPKPMVPINNKAIIEIVIQNLKKNGFKEIIISTNYMSDLIKTFCGDGKKYNIKIKYIKEKKMLGTIGPLKIIKNLKEDFLLINGDIITDLNINKFFKNHKKNKSIMTVSAKKIQNKIDYGVINVNNQNSLVAFKEKPNLNFLVSMGIYAFNKKILKHIPNNKYFGFDDLMKLMLKKKINVKIDISNKFWLDIGRYSDYIKAQKLKIK